MRRKPAGSQLGNTAESLWESKETVREAGVRLEKMVRENKGCSWVRVSSRSRY